MKRIQSSSFKKSNSSPHGGPCMKCGKDLPVVWGPSMCAECGKKHDEDIKKHKESKDKQPPMTPKMAQSFGQPQLSPTVMKLRQVKQLLDEVSGEMHAETDEAQREEMSNWIMELRRMLDHMI